MSIARFTPPIEAAAGHEVILLPERGIYWPAKRTLMVADLHLGKTQTFWAAGAPVPDGILDADLARLEAMLRRTEAARLVVLGDLLHAQVGLTGKLIERVAAWRGRGTHASVEVVAVRGNHDRAIDEVMDAWRLTDGGESFTDGPFEFRHEPQAREGVYTWAGHVHPQVWVSGAGDGLRLPCFWLGPEVGVLPSFSAFTRGQTIRPAEEDTIHVVAEDRIIAIQSR